MRLSWAAARRGPHNKACSRTGLSHHWTTWLSVTSWSKAHVRHQAPRVHHAARRRGGGAAICNEGYSCSACLLRSKRRKLLSANGRRRAQKILKVVMRITVQDKTDEGGKPRFNVVIA